MTFQGKIQLEIKAHQNQTQANDKEQLPDTADVQPKPVHENYQLLQ